MVVWNKLCVCMLLVVFTLERIALACCELFARANEMRLSPNSDAAALAKTLFGDVSGVMQAWSMRPSSESDAIAWGGGTSISDHRQ